MQFRKHQEASRANTTRLLLLFLVLVGVVVFLTDYAFVFVWKLTLSGFEIPEHFRATVVVSTTLAILFGACFEWYRLSKGGGAAVARSLGGREIPIIRNTESQNPQEQRLLKIVYEMCVATRIEKMPKVFVFDNEMGINAFVAGWSKNEMAVAVTEGLLLRLDRAETQGVIAHEFGHIANEDVKLNMQLIACVYGLEMIHELGSILMRFRFGSRGGKSTVTAIIPIMGMALLFVGYFGMLAGKLLQAAILRQREYLADASAIQFTRNPSGLGGALKKIFELELSKENNFSHTHAPAISHLFIARQGSGYISLMDSHPSMKKRIDRIYANGKY